MYETIDGIPCDGNGRMWKREAAEAAMNEGRVEAAGGVAMKCCGTCEYWRAEELDCLWPQPDLPESMTIVESRVGETDGTGCEFWEAKND